LPNDSEDPGEASIPDLVHQLVDEAGYVVRAELNLFRQVALYRATKARNGAIALAVGAVLFLAALIVLLVMLAQGLAVLIGPVAAGFVVAGIVAIAGFLLVRYGAGRINVLMGDEEERQALRNGERKA